MNRLSISNNPEEVKSHYEKLSIPDRRGQARYRCKKCGYELECTGRGRLIVHIVGQLLSGTTQKQVKFCPNPDEGLKAALMSFMKTDKFHSRTKFRTKKCGLKELPLVPCRSKEPSEPQFSSSAGSCSSHSESVLGKRSAESSPSERPKTCQPTSKCLDPDNSFGEMKKEDLLRLLDLLRLMDPDRFELALSINGFSSQSAQPVVSSHSDSSLLLENSIRLRQQHQLLLQLLQLLQLQNVLCSLGSIGSMHTNSSLPFYLNSVITPMQGSSLLFYPQLLRQVNHESVNTSLTQDTNFPAAAFQQDFPQRK
eukprot:gene12843-14071_t